MRRNRPGVSLNRARSERAEPKSIGSPLICMRSLPIECSSGGRRSCKGVGGRGGGEEIAGIVVTLVEDEQRRGLWESS